MAMNFTQRTAIKVSEAINASGHSINSIAEKTGLARVTIQRKIHSETAAFTATELHLIAKALNLRTRDLLPEEADGVAA